MIRRNADFGFECDEFDKVIHDNFLGDVDLFGCGSESNCSCITFFDGVPKRMANEPLDLGRRTSQPPFTNRKDLLRVVFRNVAKVVRHTAAHIKILIVSQGFEDREYRIRISDEGGNSRSPGQTGACAF